MANLKVTDRELQTILSELENDLDGYLTDTKAKLSKAREEDGSPSAGMGALSASAGSPSASGSAPAGSPSPEGAPSEEGAEGEAPEGAAPAGEPPMEGAAPGAEGEAPPMEGAPGAEGEMAQGPVDPAALEAEYAKLPLPELQAHYLAAKAALFAQMGQGQGAPAAAPPAAPPPAPGPSAGAPPAGPSAGAPPMAMSEGKAVPGVSQEGNGGQINKSEADLQEQVAKLTNVLSMFIGQPIRKAVTGADYVAKSEPEVEVKSITPTEITAKLAQVTRSPDLKKSDRDLVTGYYEGTVKVDAIAHLLK